MTVLLKHCSNTVSNDSVTKTLVTLYPMTVLLKHCSNTVSNDSITETL